MWCNKNSAVHEMVTRKLLIVEGNTNKLIIQAYEMGFQNILWEDFPLFCTPLTKLIAGLLAYKQQWLESLEVAKDIFKKQEAGQCKC